SSTRSTSTTTGRSRRRSWPRGWARRSGSTTERGEERLATVDHERELARLAAPPEDAARDDGLAQRDDDVGPDGAEAERALRRRPGRLGALDGGPGHLGAPADAAREGQRVGLEAHRREAHGLGVADDPDERVERERGHHPRDGGREKRDGDVQARGLDDDE